MGARDVRRPAVLLLAVAVSCAVGAAVSVQGQGNRDSRARLQRAALDGVLPVHDFSDVAALWPCRDEDEFDMRRCQSARAERLRTLRTATLVGRTGGVLGVYDFQRNAFPVDVARNVLLDGVPDGYAPALVGRPTGQLVNEFESGNTGLPPSWRLVRLWIPFSTPEEAESWRARETQRSDVGERFLRDVLLFKVGRTWEYRDRMARVFDVPNGRPSSETWRGADFRPLGVVLLPWGRPAISHVVDQRASSDVERLRARAEAAFGAPAPLSAQAVQDVVTENRGDLQECYAREMETWPQAGRIRVNVNLDVGRSGDVTRASAEGDGAPRELIACIEAETRVWRFPPSSDGGSTRFPVVFSSAVHDQPTTPP